jgi:hypothetical protein
MRGWNLIRWAPGVYFASVVKILPVLTPDADWGGAEDPQSGAGARGGRAIRRRYAETVWKQPPLFFIPYGLSPARGYIFRCFNIELHKEPP